MRSCAAMRAPRDRRSLSGCHPSYSHHVRVSQKLQWSRISSSAHCQLFAVLSSWMNSVLRSRAIRASCQCVVSSYTARPDPNCPRRATSSRTSRAPGFFHPWPSRVTACCAAPSAPCKAYHSNISSSFPCPNRRCAAMRSFMAATFAQLSRCRCFLMQGQDRASRKVNHRRGGVQMCAWEVIVCKGLGLRHVWKPHRVIVSVGGGEHVRRARRTTARGGSHCV